MADMSPAAPAGLMRLPAFCRDVVRVFGEQASGRSLDWPILAPSTPADTADLQRGLSLALLIFLARVFADKVICARLLKARSPKDRAKLSEGLFYTVYYFTATAFFALVVIPNEPFLAKFNLFTNRPVVLNIFDPFPPPRSDFVTAYYMQALGFYISASAFLVLYDTRRKDFMLMIMHHAVTLSLIIVSYRYSYTRAGSVVIALHDFGDIFLYLATSLNKLGVRGADTAVFAVFAVAFYVTRLVMLPRIMHSCAVETLWMVLARPEFLGWAMYFEAALAHWAGFFVMFGVLLMLQCYWFAIVLRMIYREVFEGKKIDEGDPRENDDSD